LISATPQTPLKKDACESLSGRSTLTYEVGQTKDGLMLRITGNSGGGQFNNHWVPLADLQQCLEAQEKPFSTRAVKPLFKGQSVNTAGFLLAALKHLGLLEAKEEGYVWVKASQALETAGLIT